MKVAVVAHAGKTLGDGLLAVSELGEAGADKRGCGIKAITPAGSEVDQRVVDDLDLGSVSLILRHRRLRGAPSNVQRAGRLRNSAQQ